MEPVFEGGGPVGLRFSHVLSGSCVAGLGIRNGDLLVRLDGQHIESVHDYVRFLDALAEIGSFSFEVQGQDGESRVLKGVGCGLAPSGEET